MLQDKDTKQKIIECALKGFMQEGYERISLNAIAKSLNLTKGGIYHYFKNKEALYYEAIKEYFGYCETCSTKITPTIEEFKNLLKRKFTSIPRSRDDLKKQIGSTQDNAILQFYAFLYEATRKYPEFQEKIDYLDEINRGKMKIAIENAQEKGSIRTDIDPELTAFEIDAIIQQTIYLSFVNPKIKTDSTLPLRLFNNFWKRLEKEYHHAST